MTFLFPFVRSRFPYGKLRKEPTKHQGNRSHSRTLRFCFYCSWVLPASNYLWKLSHGGAGMIQEFVKWRETGKEGPGSSGKWPQGFGILSQALENAVPPQEGLQSDAQRQELFGFLASMQNNTRHSLLRFMGDNKSSGRYGCVNCRKENSL